MLRWQAANLGTPSALTWPLALLALAGLGLLARRAAGRDRAPGLGVGSGRAPAAVLLAAVAGVLVSLALNRIYTPRYTQPLIPLLCAAAGVAWAAVPWRGARLAAGALAGAGAAVITLGQLALLTGPHPANALQAWLLPRLGPGVGVARVWREYPPLDEQAYR